MTNVRMVEIGGRVLRGGDFGRWWVLRDGLEDWWSSPVSRIDEEMLPGAHGAFTPGPVLSEPRRLVVRGAARASSREWAESGDRAWLAALPFQDDLGFKVFDGLRWLWLRDARVRGSVKVRHLFDTLTEFEIPVWSADPLKYGEAATVVIDALTESSGGLGFPIVDGALDFNQDGLTEFPGAFWLTNPGTAAYFPERFEVEGPLAGFTITSESHTVHYDGPVAAGQTLTLSPYAGGRASIGGADVSHNLIEADWVPVDPGTTRGFLFTPDSPGPGARLTVTYPTGAWW